MSSLSPSSVHTFQAETVEPLDELDVTSDEGDRPLDPLGAPADAALSSTGASLPPHPARIEARAGRSTRSRTWWRIRGPTEHLLCHEAVRDFLGENRFRLAPRHVRVPDRWHIGT